MGLYTQNVLCTLQAIDNTTNLSVFNHFITNASSNLATAYEYASNSSFTGTINLVGGFVSGIYIKNIGPGQPLLVNWDAGGGIVEVARLNANDFILLFCVSQQIQNVSVSSVASTGYEFIIWFQ